MSEVWVIGHKNPDTDAICSAIAYAEFKRRTDIPEAVAARCGPTNSRIDFVLNEFGVAPPKFVTDVAPKVRDVMQRNVIGVPPYASVAEALQTMEEKKIRVLPVVEHGHRCLGLVSVFKISTFFSPTRSKGFDTRKVKASISSLVRTLNAELVRGEDTDREEELIMMIGAVTEEEFKKRLPNYEARKLLVAVGNRTRIHRLALEARVRILLVTGGFHVDPEIKEAAKEAGVSILISPFDTATSSLLCRVAIQVNNVIHRDFLSFGEDEPLSRVTRLATNSNFQAFPVLGEDDRMIGIFSKSDFLKKVERKLILVDHNEMNQAVNGADQVEILEIIDHHRIGNFTTQQPILFRNEPVGSTSTIIAECFLQHHVEIPKSIAGLMLAGIVTDTLNLTSPTSTKRDAAVLKELENISGVNATEFTQKLFASGSILVSYPASKAITVDCKEYEEENHKFSVAQIEELGFNYFEERKGDVIQALEEYRAKSGYFFSGLLVTDVVRQTSLLIVAGSEGLLDTIGYPKVDAQIFELVGVVSRKKQLLPYLINCLKQLR